MKRKVFAAAIVAGIMAAAMSITSFAGGFACPAALPASTRYSVSARVFHFSVPPSIPRRVLEY